jgi:hypothetical protein
LGTRPQFEIKVDGTPTDIVNTMTPAEEDAQIFLPRAGNPSMSNILRPLHRLISTSSSRHHLRHQTRMRKVGVVKRGNYNSIASLCCLFLMFFFSHFIIYFLYLSLIISPVGCSSISTVHIYMVWAGRNKQSIQIHRFKL